MCRDHGHQCRGELRVLAGGLRAADAPSKTASRYAFARSVALLAVALTTLFIGSVWFVAAVAIAMAVVQAIDVAIGALIPDRLKTFGPAFTALFSLAALVWMLRREVLATHDPAAWAPDTHGRSGVAAVVVSGGRSWWGR